MKTEARKRIWRPHPLYTRDLWHDIAPIGIAFVAGVAISVTCQLTERDIRSVFDRLSIFHLIGIATIVGLIHLLVNNAPAWFVRRRLLNLNARRYWIEGRIVRRWNGYADMPFTESAQRKMPRGLRRDLKRYHRLTRAYQRLQRYQRSHFPDPPDES